ncbi:MAG TPA: hypothetical protein VHA05_01035 [Candidatus Saccharimonadales bacterium]|nr:hypothetical protein [Candidatus Saccharimonadales bacterium]
MTEVNGGELSSIKVRVNPGNTDLMPDNPDYRKQYDHDFAAIKERTKKRLSQAFEEGQLTIGEDTDNPLEVSEEFLILMHAHNVAQRSMRLNAALGGYGMVGKVDGINYFGVDVHWIPDEDIPVGEYVFDGDEDPQAVVNRLFALTP